VNSVNILYKENQTKIEILLSYIALKHQ